MHDPVEIRRRIDALAARVSRRDDYGDLLARGDVVRSVAEVRDCEQWRAEIRRQARSDRIRVRTGQTDAIVYALLLAADSQQRRDEGHRYHRLLASLVPPAVAHHHEPSVLIRDGDEVVLRCERCPALAYGSAPEQIAGGDLIEQDCAVGGPPRHTPLAFMYAGRAEPP